MAGSRADLLWRASARVAWSAVMACMLMLAASGCNELRSWRDSQIQTSHSLASNNAVQAPAQPVSIPSDVERELPIDSSFTALAYSNIGGAHHCEFISAWGAEQTAEWLLAKMSERGYALEDNPSRILEGVEFQNTRAKFPVIKIKVTQNMAEQTLITYDFTE